MRELFDSLFDDPSLRDSRTKSSALPLIVRAFRTELLRSDWCQRRAHDSWDNCGSSFLHPVVRRNLRVTD